MKTSKITLILFFILAFSKLSKATLYYLVQTSVNSLQPRFPGAWTTDATGATIVSPPSNFLGGHTWHIQNRTSVSLSNTGFNPDAGSTVIIGDGISSTSLTISSLGEITTNGAILNISALGALIISNTIFVNLGTLNGSSSVFYNNTNASSIPAINYGNLTINSTNTLSFLLAGTSVVGNLELNSNLVLNGNRLNIGGTISGAGSIVGDINGRIDINGAGNIGTINFAVNSRSLNILNFSCVSASDVLSLGTDLKISNSGLFSLDPGSLDLNGNRFEIDNSSSVYLPNFASDGLIKGSSNSSFILNGGILNGELFMDQSSNLLKELTINKSGTTLIIGNSLNITDSLSVLAGALTTNNNVTLKASSALKGRIGRVGGTITGNITVETYIPGTTTGWANLGTNGISGLTVGNWDGQIPMTCNGCSNATTSIPGGFASITEWNEVTDTYVTCSNTSPLTLGKGFWVYVGSGFSSTTDFTLSNIGTPKIGSGTIPVTRTSSNSASPNFASNLISNPYASPISWTKLRALGSNNTLVNSAIYVWNADLASGAGAMTSYVAGAGSPGGGAIGDDIPAGQGFFVDALAAGSLTYDESIKTAANTSATPLLKTSATNDYGKIFRLKLKGANDWDAAVFRIHENATPQFDQEWDAKKVFQSPGYAGYPGPYSYYTTLSSKDASGFDYSIQSIPTLFESTSIPVLARVSATGSYTIVALETENVHDCIMLKDKLTNTTTDLKLSNYVFTISDTTSAPRFELILCKDESLNTVGVSQNASESNSILIGQDATNAFVKTVFEKNTKASISVFNIMGQKLVNDIQVEGTVTTTTLPLELHNQVVLIKVTTDKESVTKKVVLH